MHLELANLTTMLARIQSAAGFESAQAPGSNSSGAGPSAKFPDFLMQAQNDSSAPQQQPTPQLQPAPGQNIFDGPNPPKPARKKAPENQLLPSIPALVDVPVNPQLPALPQAASQAVVSGPDQAPLAGATVAPKLGGPPAAQFSPAALKQAQVPADSPAGTQPAVAGPDAWPLAGSSVRDTIQNKLVAKAGVSEIGTTLSGTAAPGHEKAVTESFSGTQAGMITTEQKSTGVKAAQLITRSGASTSSVVQSDAGEKNVQPDPISFPNAMALAGRAFSASGSGSDQAELASKLQTSNIAETAQVSGQPAQGVPLTAATPDASSNSAIPPNAAVVAQNTSPLAQAAKTATIQPQARVAESVQGPTQPKISARDETAFAEKARVLAAQLLQQSKQPSAAVDLKSAIHKSSFITGGSKSLGGNPGSGASTTVADANPQAKPQPEHKQSADTGSAQTQPTAQDAGQAASSQVARAASPNSSANPPDSRVIPQPSLVPAAHTNSQISEAPTRLTTQPPGADAPAASSVQVQAARIFQSGSQVEMRVGLHTETFGAVQVHATVSNKQVDVALGSERGDLRASVASELPTLQSSLQQHDLRLEQVRTLAQVPAGQSDSFSGSGGQQHAFRRPEHAGTTAYQPVPPEEDEAIVESRTGLSIRV